MKMGAVAKSTPEVSLESYADSAQLAALIRQAKAEDLGPPGRDVTSESVVPENATGAMVMRARQAGRISGLILLPTIAGEYDPAITVELHTPDGHAVDAGLVVAAFCGRLRSLLAMERVALNFVMHLSGIATLTAQYVAAVEGTHARIYDTRKTLPGLRGLQKYAVACGGGQTHRLGLHDAVLIKDNHLAHLSLDELPHALTGMIQNLRASSPAPKFVEVEVDTLEQLERVLGCGPDVVLLDNMAIEQLSQAVAMRDRLAQSIALEASGRVTLETVSRIARTGVDRIAVGAITHSAPALDVGLDTA